MCCRILCQSYLLYWSLLMLPPVYYSPIQCRFCALVGRDARDVSRVSRLKKAEQNRRMILTSVVVIWKGNPRFYRSFNQSTRFRASKSTIIPKTPRCRSQRFSRISHVCTATYVAKQCGGEKSSAQLPSSSERGPRALMKNWGLHRAFFQPIHISYAKHSSTRALCFSLKHALAYILSPKTKHPLNSTLPPVLLSVIQHPFPRS